MTDPYVSHTVSLILAWVFSIPILVAPVHLAMKYMFRESADIPRGLSLYVVLCILVLSPFRYALLQLVLFVGYGFQSGSAFASACVLLLYAPIVFGLLSVVAIALPMLACGGIAKFKGLKKHTRLAASLVVLPFVLMIGHALFFLLLPYAAWTVRWLDDEDVLRATNGPASVFYRFAVEPDIPRLGPRLIVQPGETAKDRLRRHVEETYISPANSAARHLSHAMAYWDEAVRVADRGPGFPAILDADVRPLLALYRAAMTEAEQADVRALNARVPGTGTMCEEKFIPGLRSVIEAHETHSVPALARGVGLLDQWLDWYNTYADRIRPRR